MSPPGALFYGKREGPYTANVVVEPEGVEPSSRKATALMQAISGVKLIKHVVKTIYRSFFSHIGPGYIVIIIVKSLLIGHAIVLHKDV